jgi:hypothetical protein
MSLQNITLSNFQAQGGEAAVGTVLSIGTTGSPTTYRPVGNAGNIKLPLKVNNADVTNQGTKWKRSIPTLFDGGSMTVDLHFIPISVGADTSGAQGHSFATGLGATFTQGLVVPWSLSFPDGTTWYFNGYISDFPIDANLEKDLMVALTIQIVGQPVFA